MEVYQSNVQNGFPLRIFAFDGESKLLQMMMLARTDNEVAPLVKDLEAAGFAPYPHLSAEEFTVLNSGMFVTAEEREKFLAENGIQQFKRGSLLAFATAKGVNNEKAGIFIVNLAYEPEHRAKWQRQEAAKQQAGQQ